MSAYVHGSNTRSVVVVVQRFRKRSAAFRVLKTRYNVKVVVHPRFRQKQIKGRVRTDKNKCPASRLDSEDNSWQNEDNSGENEDNSGENEDNSGKRR